LRLTRFLDTDSYQSSLSELCPAGCFPRIKKLGLVVPQVSNVLDSYEDKLFC